MRRAAKVDDNQAAIVDAFRKLGASVQHLHAVGDGCPDLLVGFRKVDALVEVKDGDKMPSKRALTPDQHDFFETWKGRRPFIAHGVGDVPRILRAMDNITECEDACAKQQPKDVQ